MKVLLKKEVCGSCDSARDPLEKLKCASQKKKKKKERERRKRKENLDAEAQLISCIQTLPKYSIFVEISFNYHYIYCDIF